MSHAPDCILALSPAWSSTGQAAAEAARALEEQAARCDAAEAALEDVRRAGLAFHRAEALAAPTPSKAAAAAAGDEPGGRARAGQEEGEQGVRARAPRLLGAEKLLRHMRERLRRLDGNVGKFALKAASAKVRRLHIGPLLTQSGQSYIASSRVGDARSIMHK